MPAVGYTTDIGIMPGTSEAAGYESCAFQFFPGSVRKLHHTALHLRRVTVAVSAAFAGKFLLGEVSNTAPPAVLIRGFFFDFCAGIYPRNAVGDQSMLRLPTDSGILSFQPGKAIDGDLTIRDLLLNGFDSLCGLPNRLCPKNPISIQTIVLLKADGGSFGSCSLNPIDLAAIISEIV